MAFSEQLKLRVKRRSAFRCCRCHEIGIEVHHIVPQGEGGPDTEDNAAPLCPNCHTWFGANPEKRKEIRQMREWWYEVCTTKYSGINEEALKKLDDLIAEVRRQGASEEERQRALQQIQTALGQLVDESQKKNDDVGQAVTTKVDAIVTATRLGSGVYANVMCRRCNSYTGLLVGSDLPILRRAPILGAEPPSPPLVQADIKVFQF